MSSYHQGNDKKYCFFFNIEVGITRKTINCHYSAETHAQDYNTTGCPTTSSTQNKPNYLNYLQQKADSSRKTGSIAVAMFTKAGIK